MWPPGRAQLLKTSPTNLRIRPTNWSRRRRKLVGPIVGANRCRPPTKLVATVRPTISCGRRQKLVPTISPTNPGPRQIRRHKLAATIVETNLYRTPTELVATKRSTISVGQFCGAAELVRAIAATVFCGRRYKLSPTVSPTNCSRCRQKIPRAIVATNPCRAIW